MKAARRKQIAINTLGVSVLAASAVAGYAGVTSAASTDAEQLSTGSSATEQFGFPGRRGGRGAGGENHHLQGLDTTPPEVELAPAQSTDEATPATEKAEDAEYYDGQYYGDVINAGRWGQMQVVAVIEDGELVDVLIADYPRSTYESDIITRNALPTLISEAIEAQDTDIDFVSRATDSSRAFVQSLESALLDAAIGIDL